ncbi:TonB-dependent receptor plug domain-containing protein [Niastella sp. MAH-29]|uniref:TonB-dependent receptor plug domain-containing protein n=2 Tax=Chitinophagaceae TaxID=563835 RepID=A0ABS3YVG0_9BACT|nr:TonB-dependent receptor plug domain-containing protein [Niastella soli]
MQRISGVSIERSNTGDGQHAIIRGMDKRYNTTLVNGIKIPSPDNRNRYVPLDIFPAELLDPIIAASYQNTYRGSNSQILQQSATVHCSVDQQVVFPFPSKVSFYICCPAAAICFQSSEKR